MVLALRAAAQDSAPDRPETDAEAPTTEPAPTTQSVGTNDPQHSPRTTIREFLRAVNESREKPERIAAAVACLQLAGLGPEFQDRGPQIAEKLARIIDEYFRRTGRNTESVSDEPTGDPVALMELAGNKIVFTLSEDGRWRFSSESIQTLDALDQAMREASTTKPAEPVIETGAPPEFRTARATMGTFTAAAKAGDWSKAALCLDVAALPAAARDQTTRAAARKLKQAIDALKPVVLQDIPDKPDAPAYIFHIDETGRVEIARMESGERKGQWLFTSATVQSAEALLKALEQRNPAADKAIEPFWNDPPRWVRAHIPTELKVVVLGVEHWQWVGLLTIALLGVFVRRVAVWLFVLLATPLLSTKASSVLPSVVDRAFRPSATVLMLLFWWAGVYLLDLPALALSIVVVPLQILTVLALIRALYHAIDLIISAAITRAQKRSVRVDTVVTPLAQKTLKVIVIIVGGIWIAKSLGFHVEPLLAGLGIGGLAFGLAAQDTLKSFFGAVGLALDHPFQVGDFVRIGDVEGTVESVGLRSSRIRTPYNSEITYPNAQLVNAVVDNLGRRRHRRLSSLVSLEYGTPPEQIDVFCAAVRDVIRRNPIARKEDHVVSVEALNASSIDVRVICHLEVGDFLNEADERHRLLLDILRTARQVGVSLAFPTQTVHLRKEA